jgi:hypothetical protein
MRSLVFLNSKEILLFILPLSHDIRHHTYSGVNLLTLAKYSFHRRKLLESWKALRKENHVDNDLRIFMYYL